MTAPDARTVIAELLAEHIHYGAGECRCGWGRDVEPSASIDDHLAHQADVITALPGIAVVQVPPLSDDDVLMPPETLLQRLKADGAIFRAGVESVTGSTPNADERCDWGTSDHPMTEAEWRAAPRDGVAGEES